MNRTKLTEKIFSYLRRERRPVLTVEVMKRDVNRMIQTIEQHYPEDILWYPKNSARYHDISNEVKPFLKNEATLVKGLGRTYQNLVSEKRYASARTAIILDSGKQMKRSANVITFSPKDNLLKTRNEQEIIREQTVGRSTLLRHLKQEPRNLDRKFFFDDELEHQEKHALSRLFIELKKFRFLEDRLTALTNKSSSKS